MISAFEQSFIELADYQHLLLILRQWPSDYLSRFLHSRLEICNEIEGRLSYE